jgi:hypothetical protein
MRGEELNSVPFTVSCYLRYGSLTTTTDWLDYLIMSICVIESDIVYCVFSCPRTISIVSSNQILCHCSAILLITSNYIIYRYSALLFCYLPVLYYLPVFCSSVIPLIAESVSVLLGAGPIFYYTLLVIGTCSQFICC